MSNIVRLTLFFIGLTVVACSHNDATTKAHEPASEPADWLFRQRAFPQGTIDGEAWKTAIKWRKQQEQQPLAKDLSNRSWTFDGHSLT
ncbi:MAG: hypothetical protein R2795_26780 [Saprospiraceae bacterium]